MHPVARICSVDYTSCSQARDVILAAADEITRQHCMRIIQAASACVSPQLKDIASTVALTPGLFRLHDLSALNAVQHALGRGAVHGLDAMSLKAAGFDANACAAAGCDAASAVRAGYDASALVAAFGFVTVEASGCDMSGLILVSSRVARYSSAFAHPQLQTSI